MSRLVTSGQRVWDSLSRELSQQTQQILMTGGLRL